MSIPLLVQTYEETRRLAVAGGAAAAGDFRLKKLVPALEKAGEKVPVFAKIAQAANAVTSADDKSISAALLDLASLLSAVLYTQGDTSQPGEMEAISVIDLRSAPTQAGARTLKPLLEALRTTGSGRLEIVRDAVERGVFTDVRLVLPALSALDDVYPEIAALIQERVLPAYGNVIVEALRERLDLKRGKVGDVRRLLTLHRIDPAGTRPLVKQALEEGAKEIRVAAVECLGSGEEDAVYLLEQAGAKAKDVRIAALSALAKLTLPAAIEAVRKAVLKADLPSLTAALRDSPAPELRALVVEEIGKQLASLLGEKDDKKKGPIASRLREWLSCLEGRSDRDAVAAILNVFDSAERLALVKSDPSGSDINEFVAYLMAANEASLRERLIAKQESLSGPMLAFAFAAARRERTPRQLFDLFSPILRPDGAKKGTKAAAAAKERRETIHRAICSYGFGSAFMAWRSGASWSRYDLSSDEKASELDVRWLDLAVELDDLDLTCRLIRPDHKASQKFLAEQFASNKKRDHHSILDALVKSRHPEAVNFVLDVLKSSSKPSSPTRYMAYWAARLVPELPVTAVPILEAAISTLEEAVVDQLIGPLEQLKARAAE